MFVWVPSKGQQHKGTRQPGRYSSHCTNKAEGIHRRGHNAQGSHKNTKYKYTQNMSKRVGCGEVRGAQKVGEGGGPELGGQGKVGTQAGARLLAGKGGEGQCPSKACWNEGGEHGPNSKNHR